MVNAIIAIMNVEDYIHLRDQLWIIGFQDMKRKRSNDGLAKHPLASVWYAMLGRCYNPNSYSFPNYGARGIDVCERWFSLKNFISDMGERGQNLTLDRIDNNLGYSPKNCRWATYKEQSRNKRKDKLIEARERLRQLMINPRCNPIHHVSCLGGYI